MNDTEKKYINKPPIGVKPFYLVAENRIGELSAAIDRQLESESGIDYMLIRQYAKEIYLQSELVLKMTEGEK